MSVEEKDHYQLLGVARDATEDQIKVAYRDLVRIYHPDSQFYSDIIQTPPNDRDKRILEMITNAYDTLLSTEKRKEYDAVLSSVEAMNSLSWDSDRRKDPLESAKPVGAPKPSAFSINSLEKAKPLPRSKFGVPSGEYRIRRKEDEPQSMVDMFGVRRTWIDYFLIFVGIGLPIICGITLLVFWK